MSSTTIRKQIELESIDDVNQYLLDSEQAISRRMLEVVAQLRQQHTLAEVQEMLELGQLNELLGSSEQLANGIIAAVIFSINNVGESQSRIIARATGTPFQFNPSDARVTSIIEGIRSRITSVFTTEQANATTQTIIAARNNNETPAVVALLTQLSFGLATSQALAVVNYLALLRSGNRQALERTLRNEGFDGRINEAFSGGRPLTEAEILRMVRSYSNGVTRFRSEVIGESEGNAALHLTLAETYNQAFNAGLLMSTDVEEVWNTREDSRVRMTHNPMNEQTREPGIPFTSGAGVALRFPGDPSAPIQETIRCRCLVQRRIKTNA